MDKLESHKKILYTQWLHRNVHTLRARLRDTMITANHGGKILTGEHIRLTELSDNPTSII
jgi:hypothetical protein